MNNLTQKTPMPVDYRVLASIEQMVATLPKGTDLAICDLMSALLSGYFVESRGSIVAAVDGFLQQTIADDRERQARTCRAAKAVRSGKFCHHELLTNLKQLVQEENEWQPTRIQGYRLKSIDFTGFRRSRVKKLKSKIYDAKANRAVPATSFGLITTIGTVKEQRVALLDDIVVGNTQKNDPSADMQALLKRVAKYIDNDELGIFDAGFVLAKITAQGTKNALVRLAQNCTFGKAPGKVPERKSHMGRKPTQYKAEVVRPLARQHGEKIIPATPPDEKCVWQIDGHEIVASVWHSIYFLERQLKDIKSETQKKKLRKKPIKVVVIEHPDYDAPLILGTTVTELEPMGMYKIYPERWPVEGIPQTAKYLLSGGGGRHFVHHEKAIERLPCLVMIFGSLLKYIAATLPPIRTGFWDRAAKPTYGRLMRHLKKVSIQLSSQLFKKESVTAHLPVGYEAVRLSMT